MSHRKCRYQTSSSGSGGSAATRAPVPASVWYRGPRCVTGALDSRTGAELLTVSLNPLLKTPLPVYKRNTCIL